ncbi:MAG: hypothetical protein LQ352_007995 [Teloschistes flavicans]|nr:MAG: hypothetical protein LQ352_007995 [Teloschistes flavicans]
MELDEILEIITAHKRSLEDFTSLADESLSPSSTQVSTTDGKPFQLMKLPFDIRRRIYELIYPNNQTLYLTLGSQAIRFPAPTNFRVDKAFLNLLRCCKQIKAEIYEVLYRTNKFALNPELPDLQYRSDGLQHACAGQLDGFWKTLAATRKTKREVPYHQSVGILVTDRERGQGSVSQSYLWYSHFCFLKYMSPATCAMVRELQIFLGDAEWPYQVYRHSTNLYHYPRVVVTSTPHFHGLIQSRRIAGRILRDWDLVPMSIQIKQRTRLREARHKIARDRAHQGITVWDNLGESSCGGFLLLEAGGEGFRYENLPENRRWFEEYVNHYVRGVPLKALSSSSK